MTDPVFLLLQIKSIRLLFSCTNCSTSCFHVSPADHFHPPPHPHFKSLQSPDIFFLVCPGFSCIEGHTIIALMILFFMSLFKLLLNNSFLWFKAFLAIPILVLISVSHLPSLVMRAPRYLNRSTCSSLSPSIVMFLSPSPVS